MKNCILKLICLYDTYSKDFALKHTFMCTGMTAECTKECKTVLL